MVKPEIHPLSTSDPPIFYGYVCGWRNTEFNNSCLSSTQLEMLFSGCVFSDNYCKAHEFIP